MCSVPLGCTFNGKNDKVDVSYPLPQLKKKSMDQKRGGGGGEERRGEKEKGARKGEKGRASHPGQQELPREAAVLCCLPGSCVFVF